MSLAASSGGCAPRSERFAAWLDAQCARIAGARAALLLYADTPGAAFTPAAIWPQPNHDVRHLSRLAEQALRERRSTSSSEAQRVTPLFAAQRGVQVACPLVIDDVPVGAVVVEAGSGDAKAILRELEWGVAWLGLWQREHAASRVAHADGRAREVLETVAVALDEPRFQAACTAFASELARRLECDRVSIGFERRGALRVQAISHNADFGKELDLVRCLEAALHEAADQRATLRWPQGDARGWLVCREHAALARKHGAGAIVTVAVDIDDTSQVALCFERPAGDPFDDATVELIEVAAALAAPVLARHREQERSLLGHAAKRSRRALAALVGARHLGKKLAAVAVSALATCVWFINGDFELHAPSHIEGAVQRAVVAPFNGYVAEAPVRAGDVVSAGTLLAALDDRDLRVERVRLATERAQRQHERRQATAAGERARARIVAAEMKQAEAQLALIDEQLARTRLLAPFEGVVVSGDLSQSLGAPVQRGDVLFEIAPLDDYRIVLEVDERDIGDTTVGQSGVLVLGALPGKPLDFTVTRISPVTTVSGGRNAFRVEGALESGGKRPRPHVEVLRPHLESLRPGMRGVARLDAGDAPLAWVWTRRLRQWSTVTFWRWFA